MKSIIQNINKTLLEKLPLVWVTRAVWMLLITGLVHALFFTLGFNVFNNTKLLQQYYAEEIYLENGILLLSIVCSVLIIVVWLIVLFRHNAFKNFYPTSVTQLFASFLIYLVLFLSASSFYVSYVAGYTSFIKGKYPDALMEKQADTANLSAAFLTFHEEDYTIENRRYPAPFDTLYCETTEDDIDFSKPYLQRFNDEYQYYTIIQKLVNTKNERAISTAGVNSIFETTVSDSVKLYGYRGEVIDVSTLANAQLSYYNYSKPDFGSNPATRVYHSEIEDYTGLGFLQNKNGPAIEMNKRVHDFLKRNNTDEFKKLFSSFLAIAKELEIETNLNTDTWLSLINRDSFYVTNFITLGGSVVDMDYPETMVATEAEAEEGDQQKHGTTENRNKKIKFYEDGKTDYYFDANAMTTSFGNISSIKYNHRWNFIIFFQCWLAFGLAVILFIFRTSGLPALLLSIISAIVLSILVALLLMGLSINDELVLLYSIFTIGTVILMVPLLFFKQVKKQVQAIFINITIIGFVPYLLLCMGLIHLQQERYYKRILGDDYYQNKPDFIFDLLGENWNYPLLLAGLIFMFCYMPVIKRWKALPEG